MPSVLLEMRTTCALAVFKSGALGVEKSVRRPAYRVDRCLGHVRQLQLATLSDRDRHATLKKAL
jgi:hypothetical protein